MIESGCVSQFKNRSIFREKILLFRIVIIVLFVLVVASCSQPDGPVPPLVDEDLNVVSDISRDLLNLAEQYPSALVELTDDLNYLTRLGSSFPSENLERLVMALERSFIGLTVTEEQAQHIAEILFTVMTARQLSEAQIADIQNEFLTVLKAAGVKDTEAVEAGIAVQKFQEVVTENQRMWYHVF